MADIHDDLDALISEASADQLTLIALKRVAADVKRLRAALKSIADNTCCGGCGEAAKVAAQALREKQINRN